MDRANSKAMVVAAVMFAALLASGSMAMHVETNWFWCRANCLVTCGFSGGRIKMAICFFTCLENCKHSLASPEDSVASPADHCDVGCLATSCLESPDLESQKKCADSCSQTCQASYAVHQ